MAAMDDYTKSKLAAEQLVLAANSAQLYTCSIRPHGIFGARDPHFLPVLAETGRKGKSKFLIGDGANLVDFTYVENVAYAHALAAVQLGQPGCKVNGEAFFITNREPIFFWEFITRMQRAWGYPLPRIPMPVAMMRPMAVVAEAIGGVVGFKPTFTTQAINYAGCAHYYSAAKAVTQMGYQPPIGLDEAINRSLNYYWGLGNKNKPAEKGQSKSSASEPLLPPVSLFAHPVVYMPLVFLALLSLLLALSCTKTFLLVLALGLALANSAYRGSVGATPKMWVESPQDKLVSRAGRNILVTGANRGLGFHTCMELLERGYAAKGSGATLFVGARDESKGAEAIAQMKQRYPDCRVEVLQLDMASFDSVRKAVDTLSQRGVQLQVLIHNAGAMIASTVTKDGHESQWQANYLSSFFLTQLALARNVLAPAARIVCVSSLMHRGVDLIDTLGARGGRLFPAAKAEEHRASRVGMYCRTKLAQIAWSQKQQRVFNEQANQVRLQHFGSSDSELVAQMSRRTILCVNPGAVATEFIEHFIPRWLAQAVEPMLMKLVEKTPKQGVQGIVHAALAAELDNVGGVYLDNCRTVLPSSLAADAKVQEELWQRSVEACPSK